jgi:hypothetical protein
MENPILKGLRMRYRKMDVCLSRYKRLSGFGKDGVLTVAKYAGIEPPQKIKQGEL